MEQPVTLSSASVGADGKSISAAFVDKDGHEFHFGVRSYGESNGVSNGESNRKSFPAFYIRNPELVPYVYWPSTGGPDERKLLRLVADWLDRNVDPEFRKRLEKSDLEGFSGPDKEVAAVQEIYEILMSRHRL